MREAARILIVDDEPPARRVMERLLVREGYAVSAEGSGEAALAAIQRDAPDLVLLDVQMSGLDGFEVCRRIKENPDTRLTPVVLVTGLHAREDRIAGIRAGADDFLSKPAHPDEVCARVASLVRVKRYTDELDSAQAVMVSLGLTIEGRDPYTNGHCQRVGRYAMLLGEYLNLSAAEVTALYRGGFLHDIGKIAVPDAVLLKPGPLDEQERTIIEQHPVVGDHLCSELRSLTTVRPIVRSHHERYDGSGYPDRLRGDSVPLSAQILSIADAYDAMTTLRPYHAALSTAEALEELRGDVRRGWRSAALVDAFTAVCAQGLFDCNEPEGA